ncbi:unnamed protein product [Bursaphelenchus okinawaensis]|uniref:Uncharacterized protein n=1 Tax=Bursaphelenchus okinawaensis TaxID=465554 RepID=A0A811KCP2_9BILA|nr:unnamed protein product [Bursaphelenchus okinawaensis]CAG9099051.1 unnamed protein product [Bursaphelenchus okinawaensis]
MKLVDTIKCYVSNNETSTITNSTMELKPVECSEEFTWCIISQNFSSSNNSTSVKLHGCATHDDCKRAVKEYSSQQNDGPKAPRRRNNKGMSFFTNHKTKPATDTCCQRDLCNGAGRTILSYIMTLLCLGYFIL